MDQNLIESAHQIWIFYSSHILFISFDVVTKMSKDQGLVWKRL